MQGMDVRRIVALNIRKHRIAADLSQEELASRMGVEQYCISGWEAGRRNPTLITLWRAAEALQVAPATPLDHVRQRPEFPKKEEIENEASLKVKFFEGSAMKGSIS
jgi:transcriptional regulator with XRE-family HTH domain